MPHFKVSLNPFLLFTWLAAGSSMQSCVTWTAALPPGGFPLSCNAEGLVLIVWGLSHCLLSGVRDLR